MVCIMDIFVGTEKIRTMAKKRKKGETLKFPDEGIAKRTDLHKWQPDYARQVYYLCLLGATDAQIAQTFGISTYTLTMWKRNHPEFYENMTKGKTQADGKVAYSLFLAAIGYSHEDEVIITNRVRKRNDEGKVIEEYTEPLRVKTMKHYPPNVTAAIKWLSARQPEQWSNRVQVQGQVDHVHKIDMKKFSTQELEVLSKLGIQSDGENDVEDAEIIIDNPFSE